MKSESEEYIEELALGWSQVYKKSVSSLLILNILQTSPKWSQQIHKQLELISGSKLSLDEKSLHRLLRRLRSSGLIEIEQESEKNKKLKFYKITEDGQNFLNLIMHKHWINL